MPLPASPRRLQNIIGTPIGNVPSTKNSCTGAEPVNLDISRLSLRRLIVLCVWPAPFSTNSLTSNSSFIASAASHLGGLLLVAVVSLLCSHLRLWQLPEQFQQVACQHRHCRAIQ